MNNSVNHSKLKYFFPIFIVAFFKTNYSGFNESNNQTSMNHVADTPAAIKPYFYENNSTFIFAGIKIIWI